MARSSDKPEKRRASPPEDWWKHLPPPAPRDPNPYAPVPIIPDDPDPTIPSSVPDRVKVPTLEDLMRRPQIPDGLKILPPPAAPGKGPFGPIPIIPRSLPAPTWPYGPPHLGGAPTPGALFGVPSSEFVSPRNSIAAGGLVGLMEQASVIEPSAPDAPPAGGLVALLQEYLRNNRERSE